LRHPWFVNTIGY